MNYAQHMDKCNPDPEHTDPCMHTQEMLAKVAAGVGRCHQNFPAGVNTKYGYDPG